MSAAYRAVQWNQHKKAYDLVLAGVVVGLVGSRLGIGLALDQADPAVLLMRSLGLAAIILLHVILTIGPLARLMPRAAPLLYNRRHLGVTMFALALLHAVVALGYYGGFGMTDPFTALLARNAGFDLAAGPSGMPFEIFGFAALLIVFVMAATSHDFWLANLGARFWKWLHMLVYVAYVLLIAHVAFGVVQDRSADMAGLVYPVLLGVGAVALGGLHIASALSGRCQTIDTAVAHAADSGALDAGSVGTDTVGAGSVDLGWVDVGSVTDIPDDRAITVCLKGSEPVAVYKHNGQVSAVTNVCKHQGGPLGEGKVIDGCITCPWHGYQYTWGNGQSPPPYSEKIATYEVRVHGDRVLLNPNPKPPGTPIQPAEVRDA